jgi:hypothetical protein
VVLGLALLAGCTSGEDGGGTEPLAAACRLVLTEAPRAADQDDAAALSSFAARLAAEADTLSSSDAAELRPLVRAASVAADSSGETAAAQASADYARTLEATSTVCRAIRPTAG